MRDRKPNPCDPGRGPQKRSAATGHLRPDSIARSVHRHRDREMHAYTKVLPSRSHRYRRAGHNIRNL